MPIARRCQQSGAAFAPWLKNAKLQKFIRFLLKTKADIYKIATTLTANVKQNPGAYEIGYFGTNFASIRHARESATILIGHMKDNCRRNPGTHYWRIAHAF